MQTVIDAIQDGRYIDAIKAFRTLYGTGLKESKDAVDALRDVIQMDLPETPMIDDGEYIVCSRQDYNFEYSITRANDRADALNAAQAVCNASTEAFPAQVIVARVVSRSETRTVMQDVA
jgi:hypothetical protein